MASEMIYWEGMAEDISPVELTMIKDLIDEFDDIFAHDDEDLGRVNVYPYEGDTGDGKLIYQRPYRLPPNQVAVLRELVQKMLRIRVIGPSNLPRTANPVMEEG